MSYVELCTTCNHVHPDCPPNQPFVRCATCGCKAEGRERTQDQNMVIIGKKQLQEMLDALNGRGSNLQYLRLSWYGDHVTYKINEGTWSAPVGVMQPPY